MQRQRLASSAVISAGYDPKTGELELEFRSGHVYRYAGVPEAVYLWLERIENKGGFVRRMIAGRYPERAVPSGAGAAAEPGAPSLEEALRASLDRLAKRQE